MADDPVWLAALKDLLCRIYREWGGDCKDLPEGASAQIADVVELYDTNGTPTFATSKARAEFLDAVTALEDHLDLPANCLSTGDETAARALITNLRNDISPPA
jgi:hypothetical protein